MKETYALVNGSGFRFRQEYDQALADYADKLLAAGLIKETLENGILTFELMEPNASSARSAAK